MNSIWENLDELTLFDSVESETGLKLANLCLQRKSYINRVYELEVKDTKERIIVKFYRPGRWTKEMIQSEHDVLKHLADLDIPVICPISFNNVTLFTKNDIHFTCFPKCGGRTVDEFNDSQWEQVGRIIGRLHLSLEKFTPFTRDTWIPSKVTKDHLDTLLKEQIIPFHLEDQVKQSITTFINTQNDTIESTTLLPLHGDCHRGNLIDRPNEGLKLIDFDDMVRGPAIQDIFMLLPNHWQDCEYELEIIQKGYETFRPFPKKEVNCIRPLQLMRQIHFSAWCAIQKNEAHFQTYFAYLKEDKHWLELCRQLRTTQ
jgi:Ser/Thr protein kinase RdoA (MazF antagonist)